MELTLDTLKQRLDRLERENRWMKRIGGLVLIGIVVMVLIGQSNKTKSTNHLIEAEEFIIKDKNGKRRGVLTAGNDLSYPGLFFYDNDGKVRVDLSIDDMGWGSLVFRDKSSGIPVGLTSSATGAQLSLSDQKVSLRTALGESSLQLSGAGGSAELYVQDKKTALGPTEGVSLRLFGKEGQSAVLGAAEVSRTGALEKHPESSLLLVGKDGKVIWKTP